MHLAIGLDIFSPRSQSKYPLVNWSVLLFCLQRCTLNKFEVFLPSFLTQGIGFLSIILHLYEELQDRVKRGNSIKHLLWIPFTMYLNKCFLKSFSYFNIQKPFYLSVTVTCYHSWSLPCLRQKLSLWVMDRWERKHNVVQQENFECWFSQRTKLGEVLQRWQLLKFPWCLDQHAENNGGGETINLECSHVASTWKWRWAEIRRRKISAQLTLLLPEVIGVVLTHSTTLFICYYSYSCTQWGRESNDQGNHVNKCHSPSRMCT